MTWSLAAAGLQVGISHTEMTMALGDIQALEVQIPREIVQYWGWFLVFGIGVLLLGIAAVVRSVTTTIVSMLFFGWLLVLASGIEIAQAAMVGRGRASSSICWRRFCSPSPAFS